MSRVAPLAAASEQIRTLRTLGLVPLRLRRASANPQTGSDYSDDPKLRPGLRAGLVLAGHDCIADWTGSSLGRAVLTAAGLLPTEVGPDGSDQALPRLVLPPLAELRSRSAARRALWPQLRQLRRQLQA
ncbi:MAG: hypothetical protein MEQ07_03185 [Aquimonas sp.]|nr:hypothetical protein [Aquimonas sp.]